MLLKNFYEISGPKPAISYWRLAIVILLALIYTGCAHQRYEAFHQVVTLKKVKVHVVSDRSQFDYSKARINRRVNGYAKRNNEIWLLGYEDMTGVQVEERTLGHELLHLLHWKDDEVCDPHTY